MRYRRLGATGLEVSELAFGGGAVGGLLINADEATRRATVDRALAAGINWFDTAPAYGRGRSEAALGELLADVRERVHVSTKFAIDTSELGDLAGQIESSLTASLERMRRDSVTLLQLHNPIGATSRGRLLGADELLRPDGVLDVLERLRAQGLAEHVGITALGETRSILRVLASGRVDTAQVYYNLNNPSAARPMPVAWPVYDFHPVLETCARHRVGVLGIRALSAGVLATEARTGREQPLTPGDTVASETAKARALFEALGERYGDRARTAIRFALAEPRLASVVLGLAEPAHLEIALDAVERGPLPEAALEVIDAVYASGAPHAS